MVMCVICGEWVPVPGRDRLDICDGCWPNFAGASPPLEASAARECLEAFALATTPLTLSPRDRTALAQWQAHWQRVQAEEAP